MKVNFRGEFIMLLDVVIALAEQLNVLLEANSTFMKDNLCYNTHQFQGVQNPQ